MNNQTRAFSASMVTVLLATWSASFAASKTDTTTRAEVSKEVTDAIAAIKDYWGALTLCLALLLLAVYVPFLANILQVTPPGFQEWLLIGNASVIPLIVGQVYLAGSTRKAEDQPERRAT